MQNIKEIQNFLKEYLDSELVNGVPLPEELLDARTEQEISDRFHLIYHKLFGPLCVTMKESFGRELSKTELGFISERLQAYLKEQRF